MASTRQSKNNSGIALLLVMATFAVLAVLITEFTYVAQVNLKMSYDRLDQIKALYLAKSGYKLSLLRIKAYYNIKQLLGGGKNSGDPASGVLAGIASAIPKELIEQVWKFPLVFPIPTSLPGLSMTQKDQIKKFTDESSFDGSFTANIDSVSDKYNLNLILAAFVPKEDKKKEDKDKDKKKDGDDDDDDDDDDKDKDDDEKKKKEEEEAKFNPEAARKSLLDFLTSIFNAKMESDDDFAYEYGDFRIEELAANIAAWADPTVEPVNWPRDHPVKVKGAPFFSVSELHMIPGMDDKLFELFAPNLTATTTPGININTMKEPTLRALLGDIEEEEVEEFFKFRDDPKEGKLFTATDEFYKYLGEGFSRFSGSTEEIDKFKKELKERNIRLVTDESAFKISIIAQVGNTTKLIEAWVILDSPKKKEDTGGQGDGGSGAGDSGVPAPQQGYVGSASKNKERAAGIIVTFMRII